MVGKSVPTQVQFNSGTKAQFNPGTEDQSSLANTTTEALSVLHIPGSQVEDQDEAVTTCKEDRGKQDLETQA